jgi:hypothetical protein
VAFKRKSDWITNTSIVAADKAQYPYVVVSNSGMFSYKLNEGFSPDKISVQMIDSLMIPGILKMAKQITTEKTDPIVLWVEDSTNAHSIRVYSYPALQKQFSFRFDIEPEIFEVTDDGLFISGWDTSGSYELYQYSTTQDSLLSTYSLNASASNAKEFLKSSDSIFMLSSPGDSMTALTTFDTTANTLTQDVILPQTGIRATHNEYKGDQRFTFQPKPDSQGTGLSDQILILNPLTKQLDTFSVNRQLDYFKHPGESGVGFGYVTIGWIGAKWMEASPDTVYLEQDIGVKKIVTSSRSKYINATWGCWIGIPEKEHEKIEFDVHPNPASSEVIVRLSGLTKGKRYKLEITDVSGQVVYTTQLKAYQEIQLPLDQLPQGVYFLKLDTGSNIITRKLVMQ